METKSIAAKLEQAYDNLLLSVVEKEIVAIDILEDIASNENIAATVRSNAACSILDHAWRCREYFNSKQLQSKLDIAREMRESLSRMIDNENNF